MHLRQLQREFQQYLRNDQSAVPHMIAAPKNMPAASRLQIYCNGYYERIVIAMQDDFPVTRKLLGDSAFHGLVCDYLQIYPSTHFSLRYVGQYLSCFIAQQDPSFTAYADLTALEWAMCEAEFYPELQTLTLDDLVAHMQADSTAITLRLHPGLKQFETVYNVLPVWEKYQKTGEISVLSVLYFPQNYCVWPAKMHPRWFVLDDKTRRLIALLQTNQSFEKICEQLGELSEDLVWMSETLQLWIKHSLFIRCSQP